MKFKSELAQKFYNEMSGVMDESLVSLRKFQESKQGGLEASEQISITFAIITKGIELRQSICKDAAEIEIQDLAGKDAIKLGMASVAADHMAR